MHTSINHDVRRAVSHQNQLDQQEYIGSDNRETIDIP